MIDPLSPSLPRPPSQVTCSGDVKLDYWTASGKKTKLRNVKFPVTLRVVVAANASLNLVVSVSLGGSKRYVVRQCAI